MARYLRLRQICLVARALEPAVADLAAVLAIEECHRDPNVAKYGLVNALLPVGTSFLEIVSPTKADTAAGRFLARRGGDAGYMVICDCDDNGRFRTRAAAAGVRAIEDHIYEGRAHLLQLHPRDTGGCILEFDHHVGGAALDGAYQWAGDHWQRHVRTTRVTGITGVTMTSPDPEALGRRWASLFGTALLPDHTLEIDNARIAFVAGQEDALARVHLAVHDGPAIAAAARTRGLPVLPGDMGVNVCGVAFCWGDAA
jgi:Glyoxalase-like domain